MVIVTQYSYPPLLYYGGYRSATLRTTKTTKVLCAMFSPNIQFVGIGHDTAALGRLLDENCDYVNIAGVHWKGVHEIVQRQAELFQHRLKTAIRRLTGAEVTFLEPPMWHLSMLRGM